MDSETAFGVVSLEKISRRTIGSNIAEPYFSTHGADDVLLACDVVLDEVVPIFAVNTIDPNMFSNGCMEEYLFRLLAVFIQNAVSIFVFDWAFRAAAWS